LEWARVGEVGVPLAHDGKGLLEAAAAVTVAMGEASEFGNSWPVIVVDVAVWM
jgi:hypothetical protein